MIRRTFFQALLVLSLSATVASAQPFEGMRDHGHTKLLKELDLTDEQKEKVAELAPARDEMREQHEKIRALRAQLRELFQADTVSKAAVHEQVNELAKEVELMIRMRADHMLQLHGVLKPDQRKKLFAMLEERREQFKKHWKEQFKEEDEE